MKLSCAEMMFEADTLARKFALAQAAGFDGIDLRGDLLAERVDEACVLVRETGLPVPTVYGRITIPLLSRTLDERAQAMALVCSRLRDAAAVGARTLIVVPVFGDARITVDRGAGVTEVERALLLVLLDELLPDAEAAGVRIALEPLNGAETHLLTSPAETAQLTRCLTSPWVGTMVDTYHMDLEGQDAVAEVDACDDQLLLVHLSDRERALPGEGGLDFAPMLRALAACGYDGFMGFECRGTYDADRLRWSIQRVRAQLED